jgi:putative phosphoesterase
VQVGGPATIGVISDTHGELNPRIREVFDGVDLIVHAGDIGGPHILVELEAIAPVVAARGNIDTGPWAQNLPERASFCVGDALVVVVHDLTYADATGPAPVVISGHTHRPTVEHGRGVLYLNPGSASESRRRGMRESVALLRVGDGAPTARIVTL